MAGEVIQCSRDGGPVVEEAQCSDGPRRLTKMVNIESRVF